VIINEKKSMSRAQGVRIAIQSRMRTMVFLRLSWRDELSEGITLDHFVDLLDYVPMVWEA
jgi:hypothetical protein